MTCKDCVHFELCEDWFEQIKEEGVVTGERSQHQCESFKNKADFVEIVRCKDCVCFSYFIEPVKGCNGKCEITQRLIRDDNFFCRDGVRKMTQRK